MRTKKETIPFATPASARPFIVRLLSLKDEAARLGLYRTMHELEAATVIVGWEVADHMKGKRITELSEQYIRRRLRRD